MYCRNCGAQINDGDRFCVNCGVYTREVFHEQPESFRRSVDKNVVAPAPGLSANEEAFPVRQVYVAPQKLNVAALVLSIVFGTAMFAVFIQSSFYILYADSSLPASFAYYLFFYPLMFIAAPALYISGVAKRGKSGNILCGIGLFIAGLGMTIFGNSSILTVRIVTLLLSAAMYIAGITYMFGKKLQGLRIVIMIVIIVTALIFSALSFAVSHLLMSIGFIALGVSILLFAPAEPGDLYIKSQRMNTGALIMAILFTTAAISFIVTKAFPLLQDMLYNGSASADWLYDGQITYSIVNPLMLVGAGVLFIMGVIKRGQHGNIFTAAGLIIVVYFLLTSVYFSEPLRDASTLMLAFALIGCSAAYLSGKKINALRISMMIIIVLMSPAQLIYYGNLDFLSTTVAYAILGIHMIILPPEIKVIS